MSARSSRPLGWWDSGAKPRTESKRARNRYAEITGILAGLEHPDKARISEFAHRILNLAAEHSRNGLEERSKALHKELTFALNKLAKREMTAERARLLLET